MLLEIIVNRRRLILFGLFGALLAGCGRGPAGGHVPVWDPVAAAERALSEYDTNHDRKLSQDELKKCPGLMSGLKLFDIDGDGAISADELKAKLQEIHAQQAALVEVPCSVTRGGRPLEGAIVTFVPEEFLGGAFMPATAVSGPDGTAFPSIAEEELPQELRGRVRGVRCGIFRVTVTHPEFEVPTKFNLQTELGWVFTPLSHDTLTINF